METNDLEIGFEPTPEEYVSKLVEVLRQVKRVLHPDGCVWLNIGDVFAGASGIGSQSGLVDMGRNIIETQGNTTNRGTSAHGRIHSDQYNLKPKDLVLIPARLAIALQDDGWYVRSDIIWEKKDPMPDPAKDRPKRAYEHILLLSKSDRYFYDGAAIATPSKNYGTPDRTHDKENGQRPNQGLKVEHLAETGANCRDVWTSHTHTPGQEPKAPTMRRSRQSYHEGAFLLVRPSTGAALPVENPLTRMASRGMAEDATTTHTLYLAGCWTCLPVHGPRVLLRRYWCVSRGTSS